MNLLDRAKAGELLTPEELSTLLKKPVTWIYEKRRPRCANPLPAVPMGRGSLLFRWSDILSWLDSCRKNDEQSLAERRLRPTRPRKKLKPVSAKEERRRERERQELSAFAQNFFAKVKVGKDGVLEASPAEEEA